VPVTVKLREDDRYVSVVSDDPTFFAIFRIDKRGNGRRLSFVSWTDDTGTALSGPLLHTTDDYKAARKAALKASGIKLKKPGRPSKGDKARNLPWPGRASEHTLKRLGAAAVVRGERPSEVINKYVSAGLAKDMV